MTDKNKEQFEKWYILKFLGYENLLEVKHEYNYFNEIDFEMQIGVYLAYYDSLGLYFNFDGGRIEVRWGFDSYLIGDNYDTTIFAFQEVFKKADELVNKTLTK